MTTPVESLKIEQPLEDCPEFDVLHRAFEVNSGTPSYLVDIADGVAVCDDLIATHMIWYVNGVDRDQDAISRANRVFDYFYASYVSAEKAEKDAELVGNGWSPSQLAAATVRELLIQRAAGLEHQTQEDKEENRIGDFRFVNEPECLGVTADPAGTTLWDRYMSSGSRNIDQIYQLWQDPGITNPTIRQRIVTSLTVPRNFVLPYVHPDESLSRALDIDSYNERPQLHEPIRESLSGRKDLAEELATGVLFWLDVLDPQRTGNQDWQKLGYEYPSASLALMPLISEEVADQLFAHYPIRDRGGKEEDRFEFSCRILTDQDIPNKYKSAALDRLLVVARDELAGERLGIKATTKSDINPPLIFDTLKAVFDTGESADVLHANFERYFAELQHELPNAEADSSEYELSTIVGNIGRLLERYVNNTQTDSINDYTVTKIVNFLEDAAVETNKTYINTYAGGVITNIANHITDDGTRFRFALRHIMFSHTEGFRDQTDADMALLNWVRKQIERRSYPPLSQ